LTTAVQELTVLIVCGSVESMLNFEDKETPDQGIDNVVMLPTSYIDQPRHSMSQPRVVSSMFVQPHEAFTPASDDRGMCHVCE